MGAPAFTRRLSWVLGAGAALTLAFAVHSVVAFGGAGTDAAFTRGVYNAVLGLAVAVILTRAVAVRRERWVWLGLGLGLLSWTVANTYYSLFLAHLDPVPIPSVADGLWLMFYPLVYAAVVLLVRSRLSGLRRGMWLDGIIGALAVAAVSAALVVEITLDPGLHGSVAVVATNLAYPLGDLVLVSAIVLVLALAGWRLDRTWRLLGLGFLIFAVVDGIYFWQVAQGTYHAGGPVDVGWLVAALLFAGASLHKAPPRRESPNDGQRMLILPAGFGLLGLGLVVYGNVAEINQLALVLSTLSVIAVIARMSLTFAQSRRESLTDALTGLPNRRRLTRELRERAPSARAERTLGLVIFDLNGFKGYNDRFGHPAGDALLVRLSRRLGAALGDDGVAYRMGGDEFCALLDPHRTSLDQLVARALAALSEQGDGFAIDASHGLASMPADAVDPEHALRLADERMYALKHSHRVSAERQSTDVLLQVLTERHPDLGDHTDGVAELARATGRRLGLSVDALDQIELASRLHDIGKAAVPGEILTKPGPLTHEEWDLIRRHPVIGERILRAAPALARVAGVVRSSHERFDGTGYPDQLAGEQIPVGARVVAVCDAFDAIISERPYARRRTPSQAADEVRRCAGTQFDPVVVVAFLVVLDARAALPTQAGNAAPPLLRASRTSE
jgi:two-component system cell cycle response regulator